MDILDCLATVVSELGEIEMKFKTPWTNMSVGVEYGCTVRWSGFDDLQLLVKVE